MANEKRFTKPERSWVLYDWANSVYATIVMAAVLPIYFAAVARGAGVNGDQWWGYGTSVSTLIIAVLTPFLGAVGDYRGMKKKLLIAFLLIGVVFTASMAFVGTWQLMLIGYMISYIGFAGSCLFYDSFLTDVATPERMDRVSAWGYAMGYIGGSTIPFLISIALITLMPNNNALAVKISILMTSVWWLVFSIPILKNVHQTHSLGEIPKKFVRVTLRNVWSTFTDIFRRRGLFLFVIAYFFYIDGVGSVIHMSTVYGSTLGLSTTGMILALLVTQVVAAPCSILFARIAKKIGSIQMLVISIVVYFIICTTGFYMGYSLEPAQFRAADEFQIAYDAAAGDYAPGSELEALRHSSESILGSAARTADVTELIESAEIDAAQKAAIINSVTPVLDAITTRGDFDHALRRSNILFWCMAVLVGTCQGGIQALSRSYFGRLIPPEKSNEYFGFFDIFGKFATVIGPFLYASIAGATGRSSFGILSLMVLFITGGAILTFGRKTIRKEEHAELSE